MAGIPMQVVPAVHERLAYGATTVDVAARMVETLARRVAAADTAATDGVRTEPSLAPGRALADDLDPLLVLEHIEEQCSSHLRLLAGVISLYRSGSQRMSRPHQRLLELLPDVLGRIEGLEFFLFDAIDRTSKIVRPSPAGRRRPQPLRLVASIGDQPSPVPPHHSDRVIG